MTQQLSPQTRTSDASIEPSRSTGKSPFARRLAAVGRFLAGVTDYQLILTTTILLVGFGLIMVLSSSSVESLTAGNSSYSVFIKQAAFAVLGLFLMWLASCMPLKVWKSVGWPALAFAVLLQVLVLTPLGVEVNGNKNWLQLGPVQIQPAEISKLVLILWMANVLSRKREKLNEPLHVILPVIPVAGLLIGLVLAGHDLGTAMIMGAIVVGALFIAGAPMKVMGSMAGVAAVVVAIFVFTSSNRLSRISSWAGDSCDVNAGDCWQSMHGQWALASGGWFGVGLGASREKWSWLPEAHNDFIFAIIGEELGLLGTMSVLLLFFFFAVGLVRLVMRPQELFIRIVSGATMIWLAGQSMVNIGVVLGLLPVIGVPLPFISAGGSSMVSSLIAVGVLLSFTRKSPVTSLRLVPETIRTSIGRWGKRKSKDGMSTQQASKDA